MPSPSSRKRGRKPRRSALQSFSLPEKSERWRFRELGSFFFVALSNLILVAVSEFIAFADRRASTEVESYPTTFSRARRSFGWVVNDRRVRQCEHRRGRGEVQGPDGGSENEEGYVRYGRVHQRPR